MPGLLASGVIGFFRETFAADAVMTRLFVGVCLLVFALCFASDRQLPLWGSQHFAISTVLRFGGIWDTLLHSQPWRYFSAIFVHFNAVHVAMNCFWLVAIGSGAEREFGKARFAVLVVLSGALGFVASDWWGVSGPTAGASGAVFGVFGAVVGVAFARRDPAWKQLLVQNAIWILVLSFYGRVNNAAHLAGFAVGAALGFLFDRLPRKPKSDAVFGLLSVLLVVVCLASIALSAASPIWREVRSMEDSRLY